MRSNGRGKGGAGAPAATSSAVGGGRSDSRPGSLVAIWPAAESYRLPVAALFLVLALGLGVAACVARAAGDPFAVWLDGVRADALAQGVQAETLEVALRDLQPIPRVIELDRRQPEFTLTLSEYLERVVTPARIATARGKLALHRTRLAEIEGRFGVPAAIILALWGIESDFGRLVGDFPVIPALATLAYDGRRSTFFRGELLAALHILDEGHVAPDAMRGSWAGAMGQSQFMPSSFRAYAVDFDGDGRRDIWGSEADVFASIANYLAANGWRAGQGWGIAVALPAGFDRRLGEGSVVRTVDEWAATGVTRRDGAPLPASPEQASVRIEGESAFLTLANFETILRWNRSLYFGIAVGSLADQIALD